MHLPKRTLVIKGLPRKTLLTYLFITLQPMELLHIKHIAIHGQEGDLRGLHDLR